MEELKKLIFRVLAEELDILGEYVEYDTDLSLHGLDSLNMVLLLIELEDYYSISISDELINFNNFITIRSIYNTINEYKNDI